MQFRARAQSLVAELKNPFNPPGDRLAALRDLVGLVQAPSSTAVSIDTGVLDLLQPIASDERALVDIASDKLESDEQRVLQLYLSELHVFCRMVRALGEPLSGMRPPTGSVQVGAHAKIPGKPLPPTPPHPRHRHEHSVAPREAISPGRHGAPSVTLPSPSSVRAQPKELQTLPDLWKAAQVYTEYLDSEQRFVGQLRAYQEFFSAPQIQELLDQVFDASDRQLLCASLPDMSTSAEALLAMLCTTQSVTTSVANAPTEARAPQGSPTNHQETVVRGSFLSLGWYALKEEERLAAFQQRQSKAEDQASWRHVNFDRAVDSGVQRLDDFFRKNPLGSRYVEALQTSAKVHRQVDVLASRLSRAIENKKSSRKFARWWKDRGDALFQTLRQINPKSPCCWQILAVQRWPRHTLLQRELLRKLPDKSPCTDTLNKLFAWSHDVGDAINSSILGSDPAGLHRVLRALGAVDAHDYKLRANSRATGLLAMPKGVVDSLQKILPTFVLPQDETSIKGLGREHTAQLIVEALDWASGTVAGFLKKDTSGSKSLEAQDDGAHDGPEDYESADPFKRAELVSELRAALHRVRHTHDKRLSRELRVGSWAKRFERATQSADAALWQWDGHYDRATHQSATTHELGSDDMGSRYAPLEDRDYGEQS